MASKTKKVATARRAARAKHGWTKNRLSKLAPAAPFEERQQELTATLGKLRPVSPKNVKSTKKPG